MLRSTPLVAMMALLAIPSPSGLVQAQELRVQPEHPDLELWHVLKKALIGPEGPSYFEMNIKGTELPPLAGKLVSAEPADHPSVLVLLMYDSDEPEVTLHLTDGKGAETHMPGPMAPGSVIRFEGVGVSYTQKPFMLTFNVDTSPRAR